MLVDGNEYVGTLLNDSARMDTTTLLRYGFRIEV